MFNLDYLLFSAWSPPGLSEVVKFIESCNDKKEKRFLKKEIRNIYKGKGVAIFLEYAKSNQERFSYRIDMDVIESQTKKYGQRWSEFHTVTDRLNAPELVQFYCSHFLENIQEEKGVNAVHTPQMTFRNQSGDCEDFSIFASYCLEKAGIESKVILILWKPIGHSVAAYRHNKHYYKIADVDDPKIRGPYHSYGDIARKINPKGSIVIANWFEVEAVLGNGFR